MARYKAQTSARRENIDVAPYPSPPPFKPGDIIVPEGKTYPEGALTVDRIDGDTLVAFPIGGGFGLRFSPHAWHYRFKFRVVPDEEIEAREWKQLVVVLDSDPELFFKAWSDGTLWNGSEKPYMAEFNRDRWIKWYNEMAEEHADDIGHFIAFHFGKGKFAWYDEDTNEVAVVLHHGRQEGDWEEEDKEAALAFLAEAEGSDPEAAESARDMLRDMLEVQIWRDKGREITAPDGTTVEVWPIMAGMWMWSEADWSDIAEAELESLLAGEPLSFEERWDAYPIDIPDPPEDDDE